MPHARNGTADVAAAPMRLAEDVYLAWSNEAAIFLDLGADRYFGLDPDRSAQLQLLLEGGAAAADHASDVRLQALRAGLTRAGLLRAQEAGVANPQPHGGATTTARRAVLRSGREAGPATLFDLMIAVRRARSDRARFSLLELVAAQRVRRDGIDMRAEDAPRVGAVAGAFLAARRWMRHRDACLVEALTLLHFLARRGLSAMWVFGVHAAPFEAHCWVQHGDLVLNDSLDHVARYTPILAA